MHMKNNNVDIYTVHWVEFRISNYETLKNSISVSDARLHKGESMAVDFLRMLEREQTGGVAEEEVVEEKEEGRRIE